MVNQPSQLLRIPEVIKRVGLSRSQIYKLIDLGDFPKQVKVCKRVAAWLNQDLDEWIEERVRDGR